MPKKTQGEVRRTKDHQVCDNIVSSFKVFGPWMPDQLFSEHNRKVKIKSKSQPCNVFVGHMKGTKYFKVQWDKKSMCTISMDFYPVLFNPRVSNAD